MKIATLCLAFFFTFASMAAEKAFPSVPKKLLKASHKISAYSKKSSTTGHGACVSVDLSKYGFEGSRYILTAAHCVADDGKIRDELTIDYDKNGERKWTGVKVIAMDEDLDVAICIADVDMPETVKLGNDTIEVGDALITIGSPQATALSANSGFLADKGRGADFGRHAGWYQGSMTITHGNSGGPVFDPNKEELVGIVTAVIGAFGDQAPNVTLFVGSVEIDTFLNKYINKIRKASK